MINFILGSYIQKMDNVSLQPIQIDLHRSHVTESSEFKLETVFEASSGRTTASFKVGIYPNEEEVLESLQEIRLYQRPPIPTPSGTMGKQNRNIGFFSDASEGYRYSGQFMPSQPMTKKMQSLLDSVNKALQADYNGILVNEYLNGKEDYISSHADEKQYLGNIGVFMIVVGAKENSTRTFRIRAQKPVMVKFSDGQVKKFTKNKEIVADYELGHLNMALMDGDFQSMFLHEVPLRKTVSGGRISLTFRKHLK